MSIPPGSTPPWQPPPPPQQPLRKNRRIFLWVFLAVQLLFLIWLITGIASGAGSPEDCDTLDQKTCNDAETVGTAIGVGLILILWAVVDVILGITYAVYRFSKRS
ncbi:hypothetical protein ACIGO8_24880 [Streptomyces sp. NPDC053493]|uniref:hypothetical protein n=1 Tax=Streptomyces sp. NPDC053493 TaxID=3365705 RepID=UPI0037D85BA8